MSLRRVVLCALALAAAVTPVATAAPAVATHEAGPGAAPAAAVTAGLYVVTLDAPPAAGYDGGRAGFPGTRAPAGSRFDAGRTAVTRYRRLLAEEQDRVLSAVGSPRLVYRYTTALNGFAARLSSEQVKRLRALPEVAAVEQNTVEHLATADATRFLGLAGERGLWARVGGPEGAGNGVVVGVVDSGVWPDNPSFADLPASTVERRDLDEFTGTCPAAQDWQTGDCGSKIVAARHFVSGFGADRLSGSDYLSPRDGHGHGSHTAATVAGNHDVTAQVDGRRAGVVSGVAPAARLAVYKACWAAPDPRDDGCATADTVKAIDTAVADGVDVLNYSISGSRTSVTDAVQEALRHAAESGVFVVAPAGNTGPALGPVAHASPWVTTVGASTYQSPQGAAVLGNGRWLVGAMAAEQELPPGRLALAEDVAAAGADPRTARLCFPGSLDARKVAGAVVVCERGVNARVEKSTTVQRAGGAGMVLTNSTRGSEDADLHAVPTVHIDASEGEELEAYVARAGAAATVTLDPDADDGTSAPRVARFSARGPSDALGGGLLKPDVTAPGVGVVAAVAPPANADRRWDAYSGTSVAAAHVAGLAALSLDRHPDWSPARVKSALMTTAYDLQGPHGPVSTGAGHVDATAMLDPGLVYDSGPAQWRGLVTPRRPARARDLNLASIGVGSLVGRTTVERTVTNVSPRAETYTSSVSGLRGVDAVVRPRSMTLAPGESQTYRLRLVLDERAEYGEYTQGRLTWRGSHGHVVRSPIAVRPKSVRAPIHLRGSGESGSVRLAARSGMAGGLDVVMHGLVGSAARPLSLVPRPIDLDAPASGPGTEEATFVVGEDTVAARFEAAGARRGDDLDLYVYRDGELVAASATDARRERVTLDAPEPGVYRVYATASSAADGVATEGSLTGWVVAPDSADNLLVSPNPAPAAIGERFSLTASWSGLDSGLRWFGVLGYDSSTDVTYVSIG